MSGIQNLLGGDNDALNCLFHGQFAEMPKEYVRMIDCAVESSIEIRKDNKILHYLGSVKPWKACCFSVMKNIWWEYAKRSFWHDLKEEEPQSLNEAVLLAKRLVKIGDCQRAVQYYDSVVNYLLNRIVNK